MIVKAFIDYFPYENSFVIPIFIDDKGHEYLRKYSINDEVSKIEYMLSTTKEEGKNVTINSRKDTKHIILNNQVNINKINTSNRIISFKFNTNLIIIGPPKETITAIIFSVGLLMDNLSLYEEINHYAKKFEIETSIIGDLKKIFEDLDKFSYEDFLTLFNSIDFNQVEMIENRSKISRFKVNSIFSSTNNDDKFEDKIKVRFNKFFDNSPLFNKK